MKRACTAWLLAAALLLPPLAQAGGPLYVAGPRFEPPAHGRPITWANGEVHYYTDRGPLSSAVDEAAADMLVAEAFAHWTSVSTAALRATRAGQLDQDVNGSNVTRTGGVLSLPTDVLPSATHKPVAAIYDADGAVLDALLGAGASLNCLRNAALAQADAFTSGGNFAHALLIVNGRCATSDAEIAALRVRLARAVGRLLGLDWSQVNDDAAHGQGTAAEVAGVPLMHPLELDCWYATPACVAAPAEPRMDDRAALSRLYPVTAANAGSHPGKQIFSEETAAISGNVRFAARQGRVGYPMQGVNVVARRIDAPGTDGEHVAASISGHLFTGNAGNAVSGYHSPAGEPLDRFGSHDRALQGYFELAGLELPPGAHTARYLIALEPINPAYRNALALQPYRGLEVRPSGRWTAREVEVTRGATVDLEIVMEASAPEPYDALEANPPQRPAPVPASGYWQGALHPHGDHDAFWLTLRAGRSFTLDVTALEEAGRPSELKARPLVGIWTASAAPDSTPILQQPAFTSGLAGITRISGTVGITGDFRIVLADERGDGRPDFTYRAHLLYAESVTPARLWNGGELLRIRGRGFSAASAVRVGGVGATVLRASANELLAVAPALAAGAYDLEVKHTPTTATATILGGVRFGLAATDYLQLASESNRHIPVGTVAPNPPRVRVLDAANAPLANATVHFSVSPAGSVFPTCGNAATCTVTSDARGFAAANVLVNTADAITVTMALANGNSVQTTLVGLGGLQTVPLEPSRLLSAGATLSLPMTVQVVNDGVPQNGQQVSFTILEGSGTLSATTATTNASGIAGVSVQVSNFTQSLRVRACLSPQGTPCGLFNVFAVAASALQLHSRNATTLSLPTGTPLPAWDLLVTDSAGGPVQAAPIRVVLTVLQAPAPGKAPRVLAASETVLTSNAAGQAQFTPTALGRSGDLLLRLRATTGNAVAEQEIRLVP